jgi:hypothetical protein
VSHYTSDGGRADSDGGKMAGGLNSGRDFIFLCVTFLTHRAKFPSEFKGLLCI